MFKIYLVKYKLDTTSGNRKCEHERLEELLSPMSQHGKPIKPCEWHVKSAKARRVLYHEIRAEVKFVWQSNDELIVLEIKNMAVWR